MELSGTLRRTAAILLALSGVVAAFATIAPRNEASALPPQTLIVEPLALTARELPAEGPYVQEEQFQRGDTLAGFLERLGVDDGAIGRLARTPALRALRPGSHVRADLSAEGSPKALTFLTGRDTLVKIVPLGEGFRAVEEQAAFETRVTMKAAVIRSSLFAATDDVGIPDSVAMQLADVFSGDIDFHRDLRKGDRFTVVYELHHLGGRPVRAGRLLAAEFVNQGKTIRAVHIGTRVRAVGDAVVEYAGVKGGYGNVVILRHNGHYSTVYAHLSRIAVRRGARVAQTDTLGYVGQTGWATGPHLHYEFRVGGEARNPLAIALPAALPLPQQQLAAFRTQAEPLIARLDLLANANVALLD